MKVIVASEEDLRVEMIIVRRIANERNLQGQWATRESADETCDHMLMFSE